MRRYIAGYGITYERKVLCFSNLYEKKRSTISVEIHIQEEINPYLIDLEERHLIVDLKQLFEDLEINIVIGSNHKSAYVTINDRLTSKVWNRKLSSKDAASLALNSLAHF